MGDGRRTEGLIVATDKKLKGLLWPAPVATDMADEEVAEDERADEDMDEENLGRASPADAVRSTLCSTGVERNTLAVDFCIIFS